MQESTYITQIPRLSTTNSEAKMRKRVERARAYGQIDHTLLKKRFYNSGAWKNARTAYFQEHPLCELSLVEKKIISAENVHHIVKFLDQPTEELQWRLFLDPDNMMSLTADMHSTIHQHRSDLTQQQLDLIQNKKDMLFEKYLKLGVCIALPNDENFFTK